MSHNAYRDVVNKFIRDVGYDPAEVAEIQIKPGVCWIHVFLKDAEGKLYLDKYGYVAKRTDKIMLREFAETESGGWKHE